MELMQPDGTEISLSELAKELDVSYQTVWEWATRGRRQIKLRVCKLPRGLATTKREYYLFVKRLGEALEFSSP